MDPVSHAILGLTLVGADRHASLRAWGGRMAAVGALAPDIDLLVAPFGWDRYLGVHEIGTHSILGALCCAALAATLARVAGGGRHRQLAVAAGIGSLSHLALDVLSGATIRLLWPVTDVRFSAPLVAMGDPWLAGMLVIGFLFRWIPRSDPPFVARLTLVAVAMLFVAKTALLVQACHRYSAATAAEPGIAWLPEAEWGSLTTWLVNDRTVDRVRRWHVDVRTGEVQPWLQLADNLGTNAARRSMNFESVRHVRRAHDFVFASKQVVTGGTRVLWSDIRYCWNPDAVGEPSVPPGTPQRPTQAPVACNLWFGGILDADGAPKLELVIVGDYVTER